MFIFNLKSKLGEKISKKKKNEIFPKKSKPSYNKSAWQRHKFQFSKKKKDNYNFVLLTCLFMNKKLDLNLDDSVWPKLESGIISLLKNLNDGMQPETWMEHYSYVYLTWKIVLIERF